MKLCEKRPKNQMRVVVAIQEKVFKDGKDHVTKSRGLTIYNSTADAVYDIITKTLTEAS